MTSTIRRAFSIGLISLFACVTFQGCAKPEVYTLKNKNGMSSTITNYGALMLTLNVPDSKGKMGDVLLGVSTPEEFMSSKYKKLCPYFGAIVGRYANRICKGKFELEGKTYQLPAINNGVNHLHGGKKGFDKHMWELVKKTDQSVTLTRVSKDGEEGYPGNLTCEVTYSITDDNEIVINYKATTDKTTVVNISQHNYYNLAGQGERDILDHYLMINADQYTPVDKTLIPLGKHAPVKGTAFDFTKPTKIGKRINLEKGREKLDVKKLKSDEVQLVYGGGYDHNWVLNRKSKIGEKLELAAKVYAPSTGRVMEVFTTEPGLQFYAGNFLDGKITGKDNKCYKYRYGFCLETQHYPDSPNQKTFPSVTLKPGETYKHKTVFKFSVKK